MNIYKKTLQIFAAISIIALASINLHAATVTITQDDLSGNLKPDLVSWQTKFTDDNYKSISALSGNWGCTLSRMKYNAMYMTSASYITLQAEVPIGSIWILARINAESEEFYQTLKVELGKKSGRFWYYGDQMLNLFPQFTNTVAGTAIMSTASHVANVYHDNGNRYQLVRFDLNLPENFAFRIAAPDSTQTSELEITQIVVGPPVAEVSIKKEDLEYHPGYPSVLDPTEFTIVAEPAFTNSNMAAANIVPKIYWRENSGAWQNKELKRRGRFGYNYTNSLENLPAGNVEYFYRVDFDTPTNFLYKITS